MKLVPASVFDIDGVVALGGGPISSRRLNQAVANRIKNTKGKVFYNTNRPNHYRAATQAWLERHRLRNDGLLMPSGTDQLANKKRNLDIISRNHRIKEVWENDKRIIRGLRNYPIRDVSEINKSIVMTGIAEGLDAIADSPDPVGKLSDQLNAAFIVYRGLMSNELKKQDATLASKDTAKVLLESGARIKDVWMANFSSNVQDGFALSGLDDDTAAIMAGKYTGDLAKTINSVSDRAFLEGYHAALNKGWERAVAWERICTAYGLDPVQMRKWVSYYPEGGYHPQEIPQKSGEMLTKMLGERGKRIGEHESWTVTQMGKQAAWTQKLITGELENTHKVWRTAEDEKVCPVCAPLDGKTLPITGQFSTDSGEFFVPPLHINCRCDVEIVDVVTKVEKAYYKRDRLGRFAVVDTRKEATHRDAWDKPNRNLVLRDLKTRSTTVQGITEDDEEDTPKNDNVVVPNTIRSVKTEQAMAGRKGRPEDFRADQVKVDTWMAADDATRQAMIDDTKTRSAYLGLNKPVEPLQDTLTRPTTTRRGMRSQPQKSQAPKKTVWIARKEEIPYSADHFISQPQHQAAVAVAQVVKPLTTEQTEAATKQATKPRKAYQPKAAPKQEFHPTSTVMYGSLTEMSQAWEGQIMPGDVVDLGQLRFDQASTRDYREAIAEEEERYQTQYGGDVSSQATPIVVVYPAGTPMIEEMNGEYGVPTHEVIINEGVELIHGEPVPGMKFATNFGSLNSQNQAEAYDAFGHLAYERKISQVEGEELLNFFYDQLGENIDEEGRWMGDSIAFVVATPSGEED